MEQTLAALAASCGPELPTTTLLINCYNRATPQQVRAWELPHACCVLLCPHRLQVCAVCPLCE